ncbi:interleukin-1 receptor accessory protein isoform X2 [Amblyraja radiata]|uniref:interleukin-1 receptor accessory protein isoform X2 n=1 Tax=Amblyraja radiata TaxID=386614 RepID=UPI001401CBE1|nr:interleukin-1 receptor accessory protein isoform X2 [Amblyraja radiata]
MPRVLLIFMLMLSAGIDWNAINGEAGECTDWGVDISGAVKGFDGEPARLRCPLVKSNYSLGRGSALTLSWYKTGPGDDRQESADFHQNNQRVSEEAERLWFWPAFANDSGNYACMLRNATRCLKVSVSLLVIEKKRGKCVNNEEMVFPVDLALGEMRNFTCPDTSGFSRAIASPSTAWYKGCDKIRSGGSPIDVIEGRLTFNIVRQHCAGSYTCVVNVARRGQNFTLTRTFHVTIIANQLTPSPPVLVQPKADLQVEVEYGQQVNITCKAFFHYIIGSNTSVWWFIDGRRAQEFGPTIQVFSSEERMVLKDKKITSVLSIRAVSAADIHRNYSCSAQNSKGLSTARVFLVKKDGKEYDAYVSYARTAEEEEFVLTTLRSVLENEYGYKVCIFDRDSLPGGVITDETLSCIWKSRRLVVVLSPNYMVHGTQALLELKVGTERMASSGQFRVILVELRPVRKAGRVAELKRLKAVMTTIKWKGEKSRDLRSHFWKQLRVSLPTRGQGQMTRPPNTRLVYRQLDLDRPSPEASHNRSDANNHVSTHEEPGNLVVTPVESRVAEPPILC